MEQKKYSSVSRFKGSQHPALAGEITIWEKIDGANASFKRDGNEILCYSRNQLLTGGKDDSLGGFYQWVQSNIKVEKLEESFIYYGEWTTKHHIDYGINHNKFYLFDVYDTEFNYYMQSELIEAEAILLQLESAPILYAGDFISEEHLMSFVGQSKLSVDGKGEGVVIKNYNYTRKDGHQEFFKIVTEHFQEINGGKIKPAKTSRPDIITQFIQKTVTHARIEKLLYKLVDEGKLQEDFSIKDMSIILRMLGSSVYDDVMKEEQELLLKEVKSKFGKAVPSLVKETLVIMGRV